MAGDFTRVGFSPWGSARGAIQGTQPERPFVATVERQSGERRLTLASVDVWPWNTADPVAPYEYAAEVYIIAGDVYVPVTNWDFPGNRIIWRGYASPRNPVRLTWGRGAGPSLLSTESVSLVVAPLRAWGAGGAIDTAVSAALHGYDESDDAASKYHLR